VNDRAGAPGGSHSNKLVPLKREVTKRVLLVEDELLVGMMMRDLLIETGFFVVGPVTTLSEAVSVARSQHFDGAILDVNMGTDFVYPLAELLKEQEVPFIFVTGYASETVDARFSDVVALQKPIDQERLSRALRASFGASMAGLKLSQNVGAAAEATH
jgi:CheY-like chemotaxis protein